MTTDMVAESVRSPAFWMTKLPVELHDIQINRLLIPGSHNSGNFYIETAETTEPVTCNFTNSRREPDHHSIGPPTQYLNYSQQLALGVRYFDIRVQYVKGKELLLANCKHDIPVTQVLEEIDDYLDLHPKEVVMLDFTAFYNMSEENHEQLINTAVRVFGVKLQHMCSMEEITLKNLWKHGKQIIIIYHDDNIASYRWECFSQNTIEVSSLNSLNDPKNFFAAFKIEKRSSDYFHICHWVINQSKFKSALPFVGCMNKNSPDVMNQMFPMWIKHRPKKAPALNVIAFDLIEDEELIRFIIQKNSDLIQLPKFIVYETNV